MIIIIIIIATRQSPQVLLMQLQFNNYWYLYLITGD